MLKPLKSAAAFLTAASLLLAGCANDRREAGPVTIGRLDIALSDSVSDPGMAERYRPALDAIAFTQQLPAGDPAATASYVVSRPYFAIFAPDTRSRLGSLDDIERRLGPTFVNLAGRVDSVAVPARLYGYVSPYNQSVVTVDSVMLVALNHYLGSDYPGYEGMEAYRRAQKTPARMVYDIAESILYGSFPYDEGAYGNALSRMLYEGAVVYTVMQTVDGARLDEALGYTPEQLQWADANERRIWDRLASSGLLFTTSAIDVAKLVQPSPATAIVNPEAPGRIGRYAGYRIVESYMKAHPQTPLADLFGPAFINGESTLREARYAP